MVMPLDGIIFTPNYPDYIIDEFLKFLGNILEGQTGPHIDSAVQTLTTAIDDPTLYYFDTELLRKVLGVITQAQASSS